MTRRIAHLIYPVVFDPSGHELTVGGIQSYIMSLARVLAGIDFQPVLYQRADTKFSRTIGSLTVQGIVATRTFSERQTVRSLLHAAQSGLQGPDDLIVFCSQEHSINTGHEKTISIQHGVSWDIPLDLQVRAIGSNSFILGMLRKYYQNAKVLNSYVNCQYQVHVDYNYQNWLKTQIPRLRNARIWVIPNCAFEHVEPVLVQEQRAQQIERSTPLRVLFARRFESYRGVRPMLDAVEIIRKRGIAMEFTFAGEGTLEHDIRAAGKLNAAIFIGKYPANLAARYHLEFDVAVIPSIASEGTSLAVAEALGAGCAIVASGVGGISNMILNNYNGLIASPTGEGISEALLKLDNDRMFVNSLQKNAILTGTRSFSVDSWTSRWREVISYVSTLGQSVQN